VLFDKREGAWVATMTRRHLFFEDKFRVDEFGEEISLSLALVRRRQMEEYWQYNKHQYNGKGRVATAEVDDAGNASTDVEPLPVETTLPNNN